MSFEKMDGFRLKMWAVSASNEEVVNKMHLAYAKIEALESELASLKSSQTQGSLREALDKIERTTQERQTQLIAQQALASPPPPETDTKAVKVAFEFIEAVAKRETNCTIMREKILTVCQKALASLPPQPGPE